MDPTSLILDFFQNGIRRFRSRFETTTEDSLELLRNRDAMALAGAKSKYARAILLLLGIGLLSTRAFLRGPGSTGAVSSVERESPTITCHYMTVSLLPGGKLSAESELAGRTANVRCTMTMLETSSLCRDKCTSWAP